MQIPARPTQFFEVHYLLNGLKYVAVVEKANMSELDSWLCAMMVAKVARLSEDCRIETLEAAKSAALREAITSVRWNKLSHFDRRRPSFFIYGDTMSNGLYLKSKPTKE